MDSTRKYLYERYLEEGLGVSFKGQGLVWNTAEDVAPVVRAIQQCRNMKYLELEGNTLGVEAAKEIGKALESHPEFEIALWKDLFTTRDKNEIPKALHYLFAGVDLAGAHLQRLDLSDNAVGPMGMPGVAPFFRTKSSFYLEELIVNNEGMGRTGGSIFSSALTECYELSQESGERVLQLKVFQCSRNRQENEGATSWAKLFEQLGTLEEVSMPQNGINPPGIKALANAFLNNPNLRVINLEDNTVLPLGAEVLASVLPSLTKLEDLNLNDCLIRNSGVDSLVPAIRSLQHLKSLQLISNEIKSNGGMKLASILRELPSLTYVNLSGNEFGVRCIDDIGHILQNVELIIEDDEGEGGEEEDADRGEEQDDVDREDDQQELDLPEQALRTKPNLVTSPGNAVLLNENTSPFVKAQGQPTIKFQETDPSAVFIADPSIATYMKLLPKPALPLTQYFRKQTAHEFHDLCIFAALNISQINGPNTPETVKELLDAALKSTTANGFVTSLLTTLGFIRAEKSEQAASLVCRPTEATIQTLTDYLRHGGVSVTVLNCIHHFISERVSPPLDSLHILDSEYRNLLNLIKNRMLGITLY